jgi:diacylglycerol kinase family enzyme
MAKLAALVMMGKHLGDGTNVDDSTTFFRRARSVEVSAVPTMPFTADGEVSRGDLSFFTAHPGALEMIVGPGD